MTLDHPLDERARTRLLQSVSTAISAALRHPEAPSVRIVERSPAAFTAPPSVAGPFALVEIDLMRGRSDDTKRRLYRALAEAVSVVGIEPAHYRVLLRELSPIDVCVGSGQAAADVDLGYAVEV